MNDTSSLALFKHIRKELKPMYGEEAEMLAFMIMEEYVGLTSTQIIIDKSFRQSHSTKEKIDFTLGKLKQEVPIQYILGKALFYGRSFLVNESTLIPRPETEELVALIVREITPSRKLRVLDIGTGSGCIAITLALEWPGAAVDALDNSAGALTMAKENATLFKANTNFLHADIFKFTTDAQYDIIVSNPPYVRDSEKLQMKNNVLQFEPQEALFVTNAQPLIYYERITLFAAEHLTTHGKLFFEVNEALANNVAQLMEKHGLIDIKIIDDINGRNRFVFGTQFNSAG